MGYCKADDAQVCEECGALVADGYWLVHRRMHPHPFEADEHGDCEFCAATDVHLAHRIEQEQG